MRARKATAGMLARLALVPIGVIVLYGPWVLFNLAESGSIIQDSGRATRFLSLAYASYFGYGEESLAFKGPNASFIWTHLEHALSSLKVIPPVQVFFRSAERLDMALGSGSVFRVAADIAGLALLAVTGAALIRWRRDSVRKKRAEINFLIIYAGILMLSYSFYIFGAFFFLRYFYPVYLVASIFLALFIQDGMDWLRSRPRRTRIAVQAAAALYFMMFAFFSYSQGFRSHPVYPYYDIAAWIEKNTGKDERIGVFQCGTIGYMCDRKVINLDGKVNRDAFFALRKNGLEKYLDDEGIDVVIDHGKILELFLGLSPDSINEYCDRVSLGSLYPQCGWYAFRRGLSGSFERTGSPSASASHALMKPLLQD
jgi:hypothetical protein